MKENGFKVRTFADIEESTRPRCDGVSHSWVLHTSGAYHCRCGKTKMEFMSRDYNDMSNQDNIESAALAYQASGGRSRLRRRRENDGANAGRICSDDLIALL